MEKLFWSIFNADNDEELHKIVTNNPLFKNPNNWFPYGGLTAEDKTNFGTFENQQPHPIPALVEKITNSIDSILMKHCRLAGVNPKSENAPKSMAEAVDKYLNIKNGDFSEVSKSERRNIAEDIQIIATGDKSSPNILIYDDGEGQHPDDFDKSFLSLRRNNKTDIRFVQGKYNMGSTGAVVFCGMNRYQLIASKLHDKLNINGRNNVFGFTLVRRHPLSEKQEEEYGCSWYEYFIVNGKIPRFPIKNLDLLLGGGRNFTTGSIVKLYSYQLPRGSKSDITLDLWRDLNQYLYHPALPILLYETRFKGGHSPSKLMLGNKTRIEIDDRDKKEQTITISFNTSEIGAVNVEATVFRYGIKQSEFIKDKAVIFTLNGQVHGSLPRSCISQRFGLSMLRDCLLVNVDCSNMRTSFRQDLFMANRHNLKEGKSYEVLLDKLTERIKSNDALKELNQNRKNRIIRENTEDKDLLKTLVESMPLDKDILNLLKKSGNLNFPTKFEGNGRDIKEKNKKHNKENDSYISKRFPSIFKINLNQDAEGRAIKGIPLNGKGTINFETDVEDEYLFRPKEKGELKVQILCFNQNDAIGGDNAVPTKVEDYFDITVAGPTNHAIRITLEPKKNLSVDDEIKLNAKLTSPGGNLEAIFYIKIIDPSKKTEQPETRPKSLPALPKPIRVFETKEKDNDSVWNDFSPHLTGNDILKVIPSENENIIDAIAINMDSYAIKRYISKNRVNTEKELKFTKDKYFVNVYIHSLFLYGILDKLQKVEHNEYKWDVEDLIPSIFKSYAPCLLYINSDNEIASSLQEE